VAASVVAAGPAEASVIDTDRAKLTGTGYDFGNHLFVAGSPSRGGHLKFHLKDGRIEPRLSGYLHVNDADGTCARLKVVYRDRRDDALTDPAYSPTRCVDDDRHHATRPACARGSTCATSPPREPSLTSRAGDEKCASDNGHRHWVIEFSPYESNKIAKVKVQLQTQASNGSWNVAGLRTLSIAE
jgi:hypothetical protein